MFDRFYTILKIGILACCISACQVQSGIQRVATATFFPTRSGALTLYAAPTPSPILSPSPYVSATPLPTATSTPRTHTVKKGEDLGGIAFTYHITVPDLMAANPTITPQVMSIGAVLVIPPPKTPLLTEAASAQPAAATALPLEIGKTNCVHSTDGGLTCLFPVKNTLPQALESVSGVIRIQGPEGNSLLEQHVLLPLDVLPPGATLPLLAYFSAEQVADLPKGFQAAGEIQTALPHAEDGRYLPTELRNQKALIAEDGLSAAVSLDVLLAGQQGPAQRIWVAAVAYDDQGQMIGARRWENPAGQSLTADQPLAVQISLYSMTGKIHRVELMAEARP